ncbi:MAG: hypothetical protein D6738_09940, partial [Acidobacteria bacterium]
MRAPVPIVLVVFALLSAVPVSPAWTPGSGTLFSEDFEGEIDPDWEQGNGIGQPSPWTQEADGGDTSFFADGLGPYNFSPTEHWARHFVSPVTATTFEIAFEYRADLGTGYRFHLDVEQRAPLLRKYRLRIGGDGAVSLWRTEDGVFAQLVSTSAGTIPVRGTRFVRFAIGPDPSGHPVVRARIWSGSATTEPPGWTLEFVDDRDTLARVHRFELDADGPRGVRTWIDDLDAWGDAGRGVISSVVDVWVVELSHLDIGFTEPPDDVAQFEKTHLDQVLDNLDAVPEYRWTIESGWQLEQWWARSTDAERQRLVDRLREGRLVLAAGYANLHTTRTDFEQFQRSIEYQVAFGREHGVPVRTWFTDDVPGSTFALPGLLAGAGIDYYVGGMNTSFGGRLTRPDHGDRPFWWVGPDGARVLSWITFDSYAEGFSWGFSFFDTLADLYRKLGQKLPEQEEAGYPWPEIMLLRGFDNHYQGLHVRNLVEQWNATYETPKFRLATADEFLDHMLATYGPDAFPEFSGDFGPAWAPSAANAPHTQRMVRDAHRRARAGEGLVGLAATLDGGGTEAASRRALFLKMLESDEHTGAGGWPEYFNREEMDRNNRIHLGYAQDAQSMATDLLDRATDRLIADLPTAGDAVAVINPAGVSRDARVRVALPDALWNLDLRLVDRRDGGEIVYQRFAGSREITFVAPDLPPWGYAVFDLLHEPPQATPQGTLAVSPTAIENDALRVEIDPSTGAVTSLFDKLRGRELVDAAAPWAFNELVAAWHNEVSAGSPPTAEPPTSASTEVVTDGPVIAELRVTRQGNAHVETIYRLARGGDALEIENVLDRTLMQYVPQSQNSRAYSVAMPFDIHDFQIRAESATRFIDPLADDFERATRFDWYNTEHVLAFWDADAGIELALDNAVAHHFEAMKGLASAGVAHHDATLFSRLVDKQDEYLYDDQTVGPFEIEPGMPPVTRFTHHVRPVPPGFDPLRALRFGYAALAPAPARLLGRRPGNLPDASTSLLRVEGGSAALAATVKPADVGPGTVVRVRELAGEQVTVRIVSDVLEIESAERTARDEEGPGTPLPVTGGGVDLDLAPFETATVRLV